MMGKRFVVSAVLLLFGLLVAGATVIATAGATAHATQHPANNSGIMGRISFTDTGSGLVVTGTASGLAPSTVGRYLTLVYDVGSVPGGSTNCEPTVPISGMFVGIWVSDAAGNGLLLQIAPPSAIAPLGTFDTVSIRDTTINGGFGPTAVVACGQVAVNP
jgi:hypothetical protein